MLQVFDHLRGVLARLGSGRTLRVQDPAQGGGGLGVPVALRKALIEQENGLRMHRKMKMGFMALCHLIKDQLYLLQRHNASLEHNVFAFARMFAINYTDLLFLEFTSSPGSTP